MALYGSVMNYELELGYLEGFQEGYQKSFQDLFPVIIKEVRADLIRKFFKLDVPMATMIKATGLTEAEILETTREPKKHRGRGAPAIRPPSGSSPPSKKDRGSKGSSTPNLDATAPKKARASSATAPKGARASSAKASRGPKP
jgi:hypothetical protein